LFAYVKVLHCHDYSWNICCWT